MPLIEGSLKLITWAIPLIILAVIILPQAMRPIVPPLTNELITLTKSSSLLSAIAVLELTHAGQAIIARTFAPFEIYAAVAVFYLVLVAALSRGSALLERRVVETVLRV